MTRPEDMIADLSSSQLANLAVAMVGVIAPYGVIESTVVEPALFRMLCERVASAAAGHDANAIALACEDIIERFVDDEPEGRGFYAFGAVVAVYYACSALRGDSDGGLNAAKRFLDLAGAADDDGVVGLFDLAVDFVTSRRDDVRHEIASRIAGHAASLG